MKVILLADVERLGSRGQVVNVREGYARNYLLPRKMAVVATQSNLGQIEAIRSQLTKRTAKQKQRLTDLAASLELISVKTTIKMGGERAFGSVTNADIAELLGRQGIEIDKHAIVLAEPVRGPGVYDVPIKLGHEVTATVKLWVAEEPA